MYVLGYSCPIVSLFSKTFKQLQETRHFEHFCIYIREATDLQIEAEMIISLLKSSKEGTISLELLNKDVRIPSCLHRKLLQKLQKDELIYVRHGLVETDTQQRVGLAIRAIQLGADIERVSSSLHWKEFEDIAAVAFERNEFRVKRTLRFKSCERRWEIDVVALKKPIAVCIDCKHWHRGPSPSTMKKIVAKQLTRVSALAKLLPNPSIRIECASWDRVKFIPAVLSLTICEFKFCDNVPIVPVLQLQNFIDQLPAFADWLQLRVLEGRTSLNSKLY
jgi:Holliday junction resolvase-like predicted endonuclease